MAEVVPAPEQREAIDDRERDLFLTAGAGTGKTSVLVERFCDAVCARSGPDGEVGVENILAFTFTDRAAGELKRRIRARLHDRAEVAAEPEEAARLRRLAREAESAWISTIHAFCQRLLASHPLAAGLDPRFQVLDATAAARVTAQAFDAAFRRHGEQGGEAREEMAAAFRVAGLREIVTTAHDELRSRGAPAPELPELARPNLGAAIAEVRGAGPEARAAPTEAQRGQAAENPDPKAAGRARPIDGGTLSEEEVAAWRFESGAKDFQVPAVERYHEATKALECRLVEERFAQHYEHLRELLRLYAIEYRERKEARSALDFEDLQLGARALLETRPDLRRRYAGQFAHLMIDEFQDTNELQLAIVGLLHRPDGQAVNRLFTVGDEFQSIYAFRHADVEVFRRQQRESQEAPDDRAGVRELLGNFRSRPEVLGLVNRLGRHLFEDFSELTVGAAPEGELRGSGPAVELLVTDKEGWDEEGVALEVSADERAQRWRVAEARFSRAGSASLPGTASRGEGWWCCSAPSRTSRPTSRRSRTRASRPTSSVVAATGASSRSRTFATSSPASRTRWTTWRSTARWRPLAAAWRPTRCGFSSRPGAAPRCGRSCAGCTGRRPPSRPRAATSPTRGWPSGASAPRIGRGTSPRRTRGRYATS